MRKKFHLSDREIIDWAREGKAARIPFRPESSALLIIDMQRYFCDDEAPAYLDCAPFVTSRLLALAERFRDRNLPVIFTRHIDSNDPADIMNRWWKGRVERESKWSEVCGSLRQISEGAITIEKNRYDAFHETELEETLKGLGVEQLVTGGVMTHLCCETTARTAFNRGFPVFFLVDGTCTANRNHHEASLRNLAHGFATLVTADYVGRRIG